MSLWQSIKSYILWTHPRGGFHYDVMVTVILAFIFLTPRTVFKDSPTYRPPHPNEIVVRADGPNSFIYEISASAVAPGESDVQAALRRGLEPAAGNVEISHYEAVTDSAGKLTSYRVWAHH